MTFKNLDSLFKHIQKQVQDTMVNEVADAVKDNMAEAVQTSVYDVYSPMYYKRRMQNGGLIDKDNMEVTETPDGIIVRDVAPLDNGRRDFSLDEIIVNGLGNQPFSRDFYSQCKENLEQNNDHVEALKQGLKKRGFKVD
ncbi:MAG: hypothetical protein J6C96_01165 [Oscillospiraceae bacterium]|nr:hypothetical protein [Oscillospiraceae bacterium]